MLKWCYMELSCPQCKSKSFKRNGYTRHGKQNHRCLDCGKQFSLEPPLGVYNPDGENYTAILTETAQHTSLNL